MLKSKSQAKPVRPSRVRRKTVWGGVAALALAAWLGRGVFTPAPAPVPDATSGGDRIEAPAKGQVLRFSSRSPAMVPAPARENPAERSTASSSGGDDVSRLVSHLGEIKKCAEDDSCGFPQTDPRSAYFAAGDTLKSDLNRLLEIQQHEGAPDPMIQKAAREYLGYENDHVRDAALAIVAAVPPDPENLSAIISGLGESHDPTLYHSALDELRRYTDAESRAKITGFLARSIESGPHFVAQEVATGLIPFLSDASVPEFRAVMDRLPATNPRRVLLGKTLDEYERMRSGG